MASFSTPPSPLDSSPREDLWAEWLEPLTKWQTFGLYLPGIKQKDIDKIEEDKTGVESRKMGLWTKWTGVYPPGTWTDVISALKRLKENALAADIEERLRKGKVFEIKSPPAVAPPPPSVDINKLRRIITEVIRTNYATFNKM
uniref:Death domain-containing protein n=1 Tax=Amphimedon queenslandica TaxID=400682 RepID=I1EQB0_AMPQE